MLYKSEKTVYKVPYAYADVIRTVRQKKAEELFVRKGEGYALVEEAVRPEMVALGQVQI
jgi:hypothetical protein